MKFTLPTLIALMGAIPVFAGEELPPTLASEIASPVEVIIVTPWDQGRLDGTEVSEIHDIVLVNGEEYKKVTAYGPSDQPAPLSPSFPVHRDVWTDHYYGVGSFHSVYKFLLTQHSVKYT
jgi:hypothetical protein